VVQAAFVECGTALEMDLLDRELRRAIRKIWPSPSRKLLPLLVPYKTGFVVAINYILTPNTSA